jgi:hypothetical protein
MSQSDMLVYMVIALVLLFWVIPYVSEMWCARRGHGHRHSHGRGHGHAHKRSEPFATEQSIDEQLPITHPRGSTKDYESLIYDNATGAVMTGSQFMENTGIVAPPWVPPAWDPDAYGPSSKGTLDPGDYENDPRMLYNKCSTSCCSAQYPTPFQGNVDPFVCDKDGKNKYLASDYICQNNTGGTGCLCMTQKQVDGMSNGFVDYKTN